MEPMNDNRIATDIRRKKLRFRAWHRGMKEMDIILGSFADRYLDDYNDHQLDLFDALLHVPDQTLYGLLVQDETIPLQFDSQVFQHVKKFSRGPLVRN